MTNGRWTLFHGYRLGKWELPIILLFGSLVLLGTRTFSEAQRSFLEISNIHRVISVAGTIALVAFAFLRSGVPRRVSGPVLLYGCYVATALLSLLHSPSGLYSLWKIAEISAVFLVAVYVAKTSQQRSDAYQRFYEKCLAFIKLLVAITFVGVLVSPTDALHPPMSVESRIAYGDPILPVQLAGFLVIINPNTLGAFGAVLGVVCFARTLSRRNTAKHIIWGTVAFALLILAQSRTAWMAFLFAAVVVTLFHPDIKIKWKLVIYALIGSAVLGSLSLVVAYLTRGMDSERLFLLSGRMLWWVMALEHVRSLGFIEQLIGGGFMAANRTFLTEKLGLDETATLHSDYVDSLVGVGYLGTFFLVVFILVLGWRLVSLAMRPRSGTLGVEALGVYVVLLIRSLTGATFASLTVFLVLGLAIAGIAGKSAFGNKLNGQGEQPS